MERFQHVVDSVQVLTGQFCSVMLFQVTNLFFEVARSRLPSIEGFETAVRYCEVSRGERRERLGPAGLAGTCYFR